MAFRYTVVKRGSKNPLEVDDTSKTADTSGVVVPTPTYALAKPTTNKANALKNFNLFFIFIVFVIYICYYIV